MSRNLYVLAATLLLFALLSCGMTLIPNSILANLPGNISLWRTTGLMLLVGAILTALVGVLTSMFEQVDRRTEERRRQKRRRT
jgi:hypothetical protein